MLQILKFKLDKKLSSKLGSNVELKELQQAVKEIKHGKTPGYPFGCQESYLYDRGFKQ